MNEGGSYGQRPYNISALERARMSYRNEGQKIAFEVETGRNGKASAENLKVLQGAFRSELSCQLESQ